MKSTSGPKLDKAAFGSNVRIAMLVPLFKFVWNGSIRSKLVQFYLDMLKTLLTFYKIILSICGWFHSENKWPFFLQNCAFDLLMISITRWMIGNPIQMIPIWWICVWWLKVPMRFALRLPKPWRFVEISNWKSKLKLKFW